MPIPWKSVPGDLYSEDHPHVVEAHLRDQAFEAAPLIAVGGRAPQVIVDDQDPLLGPTKLPHGQLAPIAVADSS